MGNEDELRKFEEEKKRQQLNILPGGIGSFYSGSGFQHCYCGKGSGNNQGHLVCCICRNRTLANPITYYDVH